MRLFDTLKNQVKNAVGNAIENTISEGSNKVVEEKKQELGQELKDNFKNYLEEAKDKPTTTEEGKQSIDAMINMMDHTEALVTGKVDGQEVDIDAQAALKQDFHDLGQATHTNAELVINNENNQNENKDNNIQQ